MPSRKRQNVNPGCDLLIPSKTSVTGEHKQRGSTKEKARGLEELKAKRIAKKENKRVRVPSRLVSGH